MKLTTLGVFSIVAVLQLATPAWLVARHERTLREGGLYRFHTAPVDPYDAFRGRYVRLSVTPREARPEDARHVRRGRTVYVTLGRDAEGFATLGEVSRRPPREGDYLRARVAGWAPEGRVRLRLPMERYYLPEDEAPRAERAYQAHAGRTERPAEVRVRIRGGEAVIEDLWVGGRPIREFVAADDPEARGSAP